MKTQRPVTVDPRLQLVPASSRTRLCLWLLAFALPVVLSLVLPRFSDRSGSAAYWVRETLGAQPGMEHWIGAGVVALLMGGISLMLDCVLRRHRLRIDPAGIEIDTTLYRRRLSWPQLDLAAARVIDIDEHPEGKPMLKTNGYALPGFRSGWFRARDFSRLFVAVAGGSRLLRIPTRLGYALLLQPADPQALLARLRDVSDVGSGVRTAPRAADR
jgi:hypothetical protein